MLSIQESPLKMVEGHPLQQVLNNPQKIAMIRKVHHPEGPCTQYLGTWDLGNSNSSTGFGQVCDY